MVVTLYRYVYLLARKAQIGCYPVLHPSLIPVVGGDPLKESSTALTTALQATAHLSHHLGILLLMMMLSLGERHFPNPAVLPAFLNDFDQCFVSGSIIMRITILVPAFLHLDPDSGKETQKTKVKFSKNCIKRVQLQLKLFL